MRVVSSKSRLLLSSLESSPYSLQFTPNSLTSDETRATRKNKYISHDLVISLIKREKNPENALEIFNNASTQKGFHHNNSTYAVILNKLVRCKKYRSLDAVLHLMTYETCKFHEGLFLNLMKELSKSSMHDRVLDMFHSIVTIARAKPSMKAVSTCLNLLVDTDQIDRAREFLIRARRDFHVEPNTCIFNILVKHHCRKGDLDSAFGVVKEMEKSETSMPNLITYSTLIDGLCVKGRLESAIDLFEEMVSKHQITPDALTYNVLISGFCHGGKTDRAWKIMDFMRRNGCSPNKFNYSSVMNGLCRDGKIDEARRVLDEMWSAGLRPDTVSYTTVINSLCRAGRTGEALDVLREMKDKECKPDVVTLNVILGGLCREDRYLEAFDMLERGGIYPNKASYRIVLNFLCRNGELEKAVELLVVMLGRGFVPHFGTSNELLVRLCEAGRVSDAAGVLVRLVGSGFGPEPGTWSVLVDSVCRERRLVAVVELLEKMVRGDL